MSKKAPLFAFKYILHDLVKWFCSWQVMLYYRCKIVYDGVESKKKIKGGAIVISNHVGFADPFIVQCMIPYRRFYFLAMKELFENKVGGWFYKHVFLTSPVDRENPSIQTMKYCSEVAKRGNLMCIFPEGHINVDKEHIDSFKGGAVLMAYMANRPIIPLYIEKRTNIWHRYRTAIGKPINVREMVGPIPRQDKIQEVSKYLTEYETHLMSLATKSKTKKR